MPRVTLLKPHRHKGRDYPATAQIEVRPDQAEWLRGNGIAAAEAQVAAEAPTAAAPRAARSKE